MKKTVKKIGRPPGKKAPTRPVIATRAPESLYAALKKAADENGRTLGEQLAWFAAKGVQWSHVESVLGGEAFRPILIAMASGFRHDGALMALTKEHPDWGVAEWMKDPECYRAAVWGVMKALLVAQPHAQWGSDTAYIEVEGLKSVVRNWLISAGKLPAPVFPGRKDETHEG